MTTVTLNGLDVWYDEQGRGEPLVLLHPGGAGVDARAMTPQFDALSAHFRVYRPEHRAHGRTPDVDGALHFEDMASDVIAFVETVVGRPVDLMGCSDGAVIALTVALRRPDLVRRLVVAAGVFHRDGWHEGVLDGEPPEFLRHSYGELSPDGPEHYDTVVAKLSEMHAHEPSLRTTDLAGVTSRTLVLVADDDEVRLEHAIALYRSLPTAELAVVPGTSHGLLVEKPDLCNRIVIEFLTTEPVTTFAPIRRAPNPTTGRST